MTCGGGLRGRHGLGLFSLSLQSRKVWVRLGDDDGCWCRGCVVLGVGSMNDDEVSVLAVRCR